jgi:hypothetical protein
LAFLRVPSLGRMSGATAPAVGMVLVAGASAVWNARYIAHHVWVERDPGV